MISKYAQLGVDVGKKGIEVFGETQGIFPHSFVSIRKSRRFPGYGKILHLDGVGSKTVQRYLHAMETGDISVFKGDGNDIIAMNAGDVYCVNGDSDDFADYVAVHAKGIKVPKVEFLAILKSGIKETLGTLRNYGIDIEFAGGETADLPDQVRTLDVVGAIDGYVNLAEVIDGSAPRPGYVIIGLRSDGRAVWENQRNSGMMSNGSTLARHCLMLPDYAEKYPEIRDPQGANYYGKYRTDQYLSDLGMTVGEALVSPTRLFAIPMKQLCKGRRIAGLVHNTGGGQTKILKIGNDNIHYVKDNLPDPSPLFYLIQQESDETWKDMYRGFNMGVGVDVIVPEEDERYVIETARELGIEAQRTGYCEEGKKSVTIKSKFGEFTYYPDSEAA